MLRIGADQVILPDPVISVYTSTTETLTKLTALSIVSLTTDRNGGGTCIQAESSQPKVIAKNMIFISLPSREL